MLRRHRLRIEHQELELGATEVILGRGDDCTITLDDPLVSRRHARIRRTADGKAWLADLGSRNGIRVNGEPVHDEVLLRDGDRIHLGTHDVVFAELLVDEPRARVRTTGRFRYCPGCGCRALRGLRECPHCGRPILR